jgi:hypothetical protein
LGVHCRQKPRIAQRPLGKRALVAGSQHEFIHNLLTF